ncbi:class I SAM-dependent DNA methyltransferase [Ligilactobacillus acidipiscis]|uniref:site-specific DNA-methyltransferase (adenine-specific) n=1 Tax=Ligilactobacillus acidipiscis TaxID=89059 RepID=A0A1K1KQ89_9LACO|nr:DNA methyltransferase [Ligilactobacillus acidipiscis]SFV41059.1 FIG045374: Type II restriction enzyme, methylase subunit YeeA [Ligilactobacillus acidipiscis]
MAITEIEDRITDIINQNDPNEFIYDFLSVYDFPKATITKLRKGTNNLAKEQDEVYLKNRLYFKQTDENLMQSFIDVKDKVNQLGSKPRYIMVTDFKDVLAEDTKTNDTLDVEFERLPQKFEFFLAWNGIEKADFDRENPADIRAAERFAKLYDVVVKDNPTATRHGLNLFLIRVLFCLFAEDTDIFEKNLFTNRLKELTKPDGSDLDSFISDLFSVLDIEKKRRPAETPSWLSDFPYVDGDLFKDPHEHLKFTEYSRKLIIDAGEKLEWDQINPDILGSMIQAVASEDSRSHLGMHYTSVPNIMKVIKPLFLDDLRQAFEDAKGNEKKLNQLYDRVGKIKFMDPACGSGNFLIITYKELRQLEIDILKELNRMGIATMYVPSVTLDQFYGIEIDDFACDVTRLSLWIAEHQMNKQLHKEIADAIRPTLPLQHAGAIVCGNALRVDWNEVLPHKKDDEVYLFGNPPYLGAKKQNKDQKADLKAALIDNKKYRKLDYISGWFYKAALYIKDSVATAGFVTTNSIIQGEQVSMIWPSILYFATIIFGYASFKWTNSAKNNAGVTVSIIGLAAKKQLSNKCYLFNKNHVLSVNHISPYIVEGSDETVSSTRKNINGRGLPIAALGCLPLDGGNLILSNDEYGTVVKQYPILKKIIRKFIGSSEFINGKTRYVFWMNESNYKEYSNIPIVKKRVDLVYQFRKNGGQSARGAIDTPYKFFTRELRDEALIKSHNDQKKLLMIIIPRVSSENRLYVPMGIVGEDTIISDSATAIYNAPLWLFGLLESRMHMTWLRAVGGRLKTDYRYSAGLVYNTFPVPELSSRRKNEIEEIVWEILDIRDEEGGTLAELYGSPLAAKNPKPMNPRLKAAHEELDQVVDRAYRVRPFKDDNERLALLLEMYSQKVNEEK